MMNPIIQRELVGTLRTRRAVALQFVMVGAMALLVALRWPSDSIVDVTGRQAREVFRLFGYGLLTALILLTPIFPAASIVRERREGTLALLLNSPMSPWAIYLGKMLGVLGFVLLLIVLSLPAAAACYAMGGVDPSQLAGVYVVLVLLSIQYTTLGLLVSSYASSSDSSLRLTYGLVLLLAVIVLAPQQFLQGLLPPSSAGAIDWLRCLSPIPAMMEALSHADVGGQGLASTGGLVARFAFLAAVSSAIFAIWTAARFNQRMFDRPRGTGKVTDEQSASVQAYRRVMYMWFFDPQRRAGLIGPLTNAVMIKEFRTRRFGRGYWMMRIMGVCLMLSLGLMLATAQGTMEWGVAPLATVMVLLSMSLIVLVTPSLASGLIAGERESGGWQLLQMTPLSSWSIVTGKLMSVGWTLLLILLATLPGYAVVLAIEPAQTPRVLSVLATLVLTATFALLMTATVSSLFRRTAQATATAYTLLVALCAGTMLLWLGEAAPFSHATVAAVLRLNPVAAALELIDAPGFSGPLGYRIVPTNWWIMGGGCGLSLLVLVVQTWRLTRPR